MTKIKTTKIFAGEYEVTNGTLTATVTNEIDFGDGFKWLARSDALDWVSEPQLTKRDAVAVVVEFFERVAR